MSHLIKVSLLTALVILSGCSKNPVTGRNELHLVSTQQEIKMGSKQYLYGQQASGGKYNLDPELSSYVQEVGQKLVKLSHRSTLPFEFVVLNDSVPNAWAMPGGKIAVNRGLLVNLNNEAELAAVLGHEITHAAARHSAKAMERQLVITTGLAAATVAAAATSKQEDNSLKQGAIIGGATLAAGLITTKYGRDAELEADHYGMNYMAKAGYDPYAAVTLQQTFVKLADNKSPSWLEGLFASHPPSQERVKANSQRAQSMPKDLDLGQARFQQKIAKLKQRAPAYENYDKGLKALSKGELASALTLANQAIQQEPKEALFYGLKGDVLAKQDHLEEALKAYEQALKNEDKYFYYYHQKGLLLEKMGKKQEAKSALERSLALLPTESAQKALKNIG